MPARAWRAQKVLMKGVKATMKIGLTAWNQVAGISQPRPRKERTCRSELESAQSARVLPCCS